MIFRTHFENIDQIKQCIEVYGCCWFHGDGNMFLTEKTSDDRKKHSNPSSEEATYRLYFASVDQVPSTLEALNSDLMKAKNKETLADRGAQTTSGVKTLPARNKGQEAANLKIKRTDSSYVGEAGKTEDQILEEEIDKAIEKERLENSKPVDKKSAKSGSISGL